jgi:hypothetical protein
MQTSLLLAARVSRVLSTAAARADTLVVCIAASLAALNVQLGTADTGVTPTRGFNDDDVVFSLHHAEGVT